MSNAEKKTYEVWDSRATGSRTEPITVVIDPEFESLIAPLSPEERAQLKANIIAENGNAFIREPLIVWTDYSAPTSELTGWLLDGHTRLSILVEHLAEQQAQGVTNKKLFAPINVIDPETIPDRAAALLWIEENQVGRRNLTDDQRAIIWDSIRERRSEILQREATAKARAAKTSESDSSETDETAAEPKPDTPEPPKPKRDIRKEIAKESGLPENKFKTVAKLKKTAPEKVADVRSGKTTLREAAKESKPAKSAPAPESAELTVKELVNWAVDFINKHSALQGVSMRDRWRNGKVELHINQVEPAAAKKLVEYYLRLKSGHAPKTAPASVSDHHRLPPYIDQILKMLRNRNYITKWAVQKYTEISVTDPDGHKRTGEDESYQSEGMARGAMKGMIRQNVMKKWSEKDFVIASAARWKVGYKSDATFWTTAVGFESLADANAAVAFVEREWELRQAEHAVPVPAPKKAAKPTVNATEAI